MLKQVLLMCFALFIFTNSLGQEKRFELKQILILSRHGIRAPLETVNRTSSKHWPKWTVENGHLTPKGAMLEGNMGEYFSDWLSTENFTFDSVYVYSSSLKRTIESAQAFLNKVFKNHNVTVEFEPELLNNPIFIPLVNNDTEYYKITVVENMKSKLNASKLFDSYKMLNEILDLKNSDACTKEGICDFTNASNQFYFENGQQPYILGVMSLANSVVDAFLMEYYEGMPMEDVAWGLIKTDLLWQNIARIVNENLNARINATGFPEIASKPLVTLIYDLLENRRIKFSVLYGHDSTFIMLMSALGINHYELPHQYEKTPVGGKLVFQKWLDHQENREFFKLNYIYQSSEQLRNGSKLTSKDGPLSIQLYLKDCCKNETELCTWTDFIEILKRIIL